MYLFLFSPIRTTCPAQLILLDLITRIVLGEEYREQRSSLCSATWKNFPTENPQILGATVQNFVTRETWRLGFVHPWPGYNKLGKIWNKVVVAWSS
jgi:hypothetical protein